MAGNVVFVKGRKIDQDRLREFLKDVNIDNIDQFETDEGYWKSPITGDLFETKFQLWGQLGAYLRTVEHKDPREPTRAGYVRALRRGLEPTDAQKEAHREYARQHRRKRREKLLAEKGIDPTVPTDTTPSKPEPVVPFMSWE